MNKRNIYSVICILMILSNLNAQNKAKISSKKPMPKSSKIQLATIPKPMEMLCLKPWIEPIMPFKPFKKYVPYLFTYKYETVQEKDGKCFPLNTSTDSTLIRKELADCQKYLEDLEDFKEKYPDYYQNPSKRQEDEEKYKKDLEEYEIKKQKYDIEMKKYLADKQEYFNCLAYNKGLKTNSNSQSQNKSSNIIIPTVDKYADYERVYVKTGDLGCTNVIPKYAENLETSLLVKNHGDLDLVIKLIDLQDDIAIRMVYIQKNSSFEIKNIPEGRYVIREAHGDVWKQKVDNGKCIGVFTENANYRQSKNIADFYLKKRTEGNYIVTSVPSYELE